MREQIEAWAQKLLQLPHQEGRAQLISLEPTDEARPLLALILPGWPEVGLVSYHTFGLSEVGYGDKELCLILDSETENWADALLDLIDTNRATEAWVPGAMFNSQNEVGEGLCFEGWLVGLPLEALSSELAVYPIYNQEIQILKSVGLAKFLSRLGEIKYQSDRTPLTSAA